MAGYCVKCFTELNEQGLCPVCDAHTIAAMAQPATPAAPVYVAPEVPVPPTAPVYAAPEIPMYEETALLVEDEIPAPTSCKFCGKCGSALGENGLCPICDAAPALKFCMKCGGALDENGLCPACDTVVALEDTAVTNAVAVDAAVAVAEDVAPAEKKAPKKVTALSVIATVLLSICLFVTMLASTGILTIRNTISKNGIANLTESLDVTQLLKSTGTADNDAFGKLYDRLERDHGIELDDEKLGELIDESTVPDYVSNKVGEFSGDFFSGDAELVITKDEMVDLVWENRDLLENEIDKDFDDHKINKADCRQIADWLFNDDELVIISTDQLQDTAPVLYQTANIALSWVAFGFFLLLSALVGFVMCRNSLSQAAIGGGVVFILLGTVGAFAAAVVAWIPGLWSSIAGNNLILSVVGSVLKVNAWIFAALLVLGILMLVARSVVKHIISKKA